MWRKNVPKLPLNIIKQFAMTDSMMEELCDGEFMFILSTGIAVMLRER